MRLNIRSERQASCSREALLNRTVVDFLSWSSEVHRLMGWSSCLDTGRWECLKRMKLYRLISHLISQKYHEKKIILHGVTRREARSMASRNSGWHLSLLQILVLLMENSQHFYWAYPGEVLHPRLQSLQRVSDAQCIVVCPAPEQQERAFLFTALRGVNMVHPQLHQPFCTFHT